LFALGSNRTLGHQFHRHPVCFVNERSQKHVGSIYADITQLRRQPFPPEMNGQPFISNWTENVAVLFSLAFLSFVLFFFVLAVETVANPTP
jgi:hypothetical protein